MKPMDNASLVTKLSNVQVAYTDEILHACAKRLQAGDDAEGVIIETIEALAEERKRLQSLRVNEAVAQGLPIMAPVRLVFPLGPDGVPSSDEIDALIKTAQERGSYDRNAPRRWRKDGVYGCYFPSTGLSVSQGDLCDQGVPKDVTWIDSIADIPWAQPGRPLVEVFAEDEAKKV